MDTPVGLRGRRKLEVGCRSGMVYYNMALRSTTIYDTTAAKVAYRVDLGPGRRPHPLPSRSTIFRTSSALWLGEVLDQREGEQQRQPRERARTQLRRSRHGGGGWLPHPKRVPSHDVACVAASSSGDRDTPTLTLTLRNHPCCPS